MSDNVYHPKHYTQGGIECIDALKAATVGKTGIEAVCVANVIKYLWRYEEKNNLEDVKKARWYINRLIQELEEKEQPKTNNAPIDTPDNNITEGHCIDCEYFDTEFTDEPCCYCKYTAADGLEEFNNRPLLFKSAK